MENILLVIFLSSLYILNACQVATMAVEPDFKQSAEELAVTGRKAFAPNGNFKIGPFTVANINRGWRNSGGFSVLGYENVKSNQKYEFNLQDGAGQEWYIVGAARLQEKTLNSTNGVTIALSPNNEYYTGYFTSPESGRWQLVTTDPGQYLKRDKFIGELTNGKTRFQITPVYSFQGSKLPSGTILGYEFKQPDGAKIAAVQVINNGKFWLKSGLSADIRMVLTSASAALLLYDKLYEAAAS